MPNEKRLMSASKCDKRSFRTKPLPGGKKLRVCCARGDWNAKAGRCRTGMKGQAIISRSRGLGVALAADIKSVRIVRD